ncbi:MAG: adenylyl-sulfate kinase [Oscillospiraceae bacterium]|jgi:alpha-galactosidase|nr:adenylyl-sulfate kinase [Oscillospiraceae bacterium]
MDDFRNLETVWNPPTLPASIPQGDMPGDKIRIDAVHLRKAAMLFPPLKALLRDCLAENPHRRAVVAVCGGSGVGKSEIASLLSFYLNSLGVGSYTLSGDNYPHRIPRDNDAERLRVYRAGGLRGLVASGRYEARMGEALRALWAQDADADPARVAEFPWLSIYHRAGRRALTGYLGTPSEIDFDEVSALIARFKQGEDALPLKRMGRERDQLWYDLVDMRETRVMIIEWTHSNSDFIEGVDIPILLSSTPAETLAHRRARGRDGQTDSPFTSMVLEIEQQKLEAQAHKARLILSKEGELLTYQDYRKQMA